MKTEIRMIDGVPTAVKIARPRRNPPSHQTYVTPISLEAALVDAADGIFHTADHGNQRRRVQARIRKLA